MPLSLASVKSRFVPANLGSPGQRAVKRGCVCVSLEYLSNFLGCLYWLVVFNGNWTSVSHVAKDHFFKHWVVASVFFPSVLLRCWLGSRKGIRPVKNWVVRCWRGYLSGAKCRLAYGPADAIATRCLLLQQNPGWFYLSGTGWPR